MWDAIEPFVLTRALRPTIELSVQRETWQLLNRASKQGLVSLDQVAVSAAGDRRASFCEIEIEVGSDEAACGEVAELLATELPVVPALDNKLAHALLLVGLRPSAVAATEPEATEPTLGGLLAHRVAVHLAGIRSAEARIRGDGAADAVHQLRVHLRRLRTLVRQELERDAEEFGDERRTVLVERAAGLLADQSRHDVDRAHGRLESKRCQAHDAGGLGKRCGIHGLFCSHG